MARPPLLRVPELVKARNNQNEIQTWLEVFRRLNELIDGDGLPEFIAAINTLGTYPALAGALSISDIGGAGTAAAGDIGTDVQAYAAALAQLSGLTLAQGDLLYRNASQLTNLAKGTAGQVLTMNAGATAPEWAAAGGHLLGRTRLSKSSNQTLSNATQTDITWGTEDEDALGTFASGTSATNINVPTGATYANATFGIDWAANSTSNRLHYIIYNGTAVGTQFLPAIGSSRTTFNTGDFPVTAGNVLKCAAHQSSGGNLDVEANSDTFFRVTWFSS